MISLKIRRLQQDDEYIDNILGLGLSTARGHVEIRPGHESYCTAILPPCVTYQGEDRQWHTIQVSEEGFLRFEDDQCQLWVL